MKRKLTSLFKRCGLKDVNATKMGEVRRILNEKQEKKPLQHKFIWNLKFNEKYLDQRDSGESKAKRYWEISTEEICRSNR